jgi:hypothetical protein
MGALSKDAASVILLLICQDFHKRAGNGRLNKWAKSGDIAVEQLKAQTTGSGNFQKTTEDYYFIIAKGTKSMNRFMAEAVGDIVLSGLSIGGGAGAAMLPTPLGPVVSSSMSAADTAHMGGGIGGYINFCRNPIPALTSALNTGQRSGLEHIQDPDKRDQALLHYLNYADGLTILLTGIARFKYHPGAASNIFINVRYAQGDLSQLRTRSRYMKEGFSTLTNVDTWFNDCTLKYQFSVATSKLQKTSNMLR